MKKKKQDTAVNNESSLVVFTNLMILLLAFFIVLVNLSTTEEHKKQAALNSLFGSFGFHSGGLSPVGSSEGMDITMPDAPIFKDDIKVETLQNIAAANGLSSDVEIRRAPEKIVLTLGDRILFKKGSFTISRKSMKFLKEISEFLKDGQGLIEIRGYTDKT